MKIKSILSLFAFALVMGLFISSCGSDTAKGMESDMKEATEATEGAAATAADAVEGAAATAADAVEGAADATKEAVKEATDGHEGHNH